MNMSSLKGQVAIVTGGVSGIGKAVAQCLLKVGVSVVIVDQDEAKGNQLIAEWQENRKNQVAFFPMDLKNYAHLSDVIDFTHKHYQRIDLLVNNAGIYPSKPSLHITETDWDLVFDLNVKAAFFLAQKTTQYMIKQQVKGTIINVASTAALTARPGVAHYSSSKAALLMMTRVLALEWAEYGIRVNAVCPGLVAPDHFEQALPTEIQRKEYTEKISKAPLKRAASPEEIAYGVLYMANQEMSGFMTGQSLVLDGGYTAGHVFSTFSEQLNKEDT